MNKFLTFVLCAVLSCLSTDLFAAELFEYQATDRFGLMTQVEQDRVSALRANPHNKGAYPVNFKRANLNTRQLTFTTPDGVRQDYVGKFTSDDPSHSFTWVGESEDKTSSVHLIGNVHSLIGKITVRERTFSVTVTSEGTMVLVEIAKRPMADDTPKATGTHPLPSLSRRLDATTQATGTPQIRVLFLWSDAAANSWGNWTQVTDTTNYMVNDANLSFSNSGIDLSVAISQLTAVPALPYYSNGISANLSNLMADNDVKMRRDNTASDVIVLVAQDVLNENIYGAVPQIYATPQTAYIVMSTEGIYTETFQHELGHIIGTRHQSTGAYLSNDGNPNDPSNFPTPYGHGWTLDFPQGNTWNCSQTIMAWPTYTAWDKCNGGYRLNYWSDPNFLWYNYPMGNASAADDHRTISELGAAVASFNLTNLYYPNNNPPPVPLTPAGKAVNVIMNYMNLLN